MTAFSWRAFVLNADKNLLRQAKVLAKKGQAQAKLDHPDEVKDANRGDYTKLTLRLKHELETKRTKLTERRDRISIGQR